MQRWAGGEAEGHTDRQTDGAPVHSGARLASRRHDHTTSSTNTARNGMNSGVAIGPAGEKGSRHYKQQTETAVFIRLASLL